jgi:two-component system OmpR family sensor kinase
VEISVSDNGPGIPSDQLERIFERFTRGDAGLTQRVGGTGLGLAISKSLVELHGGSIAAESTPGRGSTFRVRLPIATGVAVDGGQGRATAEAS